MAQVHHDRVLCRGPARADEWHHGRRLARCLAGFIGPLQKARETVNKQVSGITRWASRSDPDGTVLDVVPGSPADSAGVAPDMKLIAVNGRRYSADVLRDAISASKQTGHVELMCENKEFYRTFTLDYREGRRHPVLVRDDGVHDYVGEILAPHAH
jgi:predicted metalloprotease with PDZ domain